MQRLRKFLDRQEPLFTPGGRFEKYHALYEMADTIFFSPADVTRGSPHVRDSLDLKRVMIVVVFAAVPCVLIGIWNTGFQANAAMEALGSETISGWRGALLPVLGAHTNSGNIYDNFVHGLLYFLPIYIVTMAVGGFWEILFAGVRDHEINEGFFVTSLLYALILPASIPLWQVALGISFGIVIGKEVFGGTGKNFLNPALAGRAFLYFAYPAEISGDTVWTPVDGFSGATALGASALEGMSGVIETGLTWSAAFYGQMQGSIGETSTAACIFGAIVLVYSGIASWRIIAGVLAGLIVPAIMFSGIDSANPMLSMPWHWHIVLGGFAFGAVFMATDPVTAPDTQAGHWVFGIVVGALTYVIRVVNPAFPEGIMLAILFGNIFAPIIDHIVIRANIKRRLRRSA